MKGFAPAHERVLLNHEICELAKSFGDTPGIFRSHLRLIIDASELNDKSLFDSSVAACEDIARRIDLPHYSWRVASVKALQATIAGEYSNALTLLDQAETYAQQIDDKSAQLTIPLQRLAIMRYWDSPQTPDYLVLKAQLATSFQQFPHAEIYIHAQQACAAFSVGHFNVNTDLNESILEEMFNTGDIFSLCMLGELVVIQGNKSIAEQIYQELLSVKDDGTTSGLMGANWGGPVAKVLGLIALLNGEYNIASDHLHSALLISKKMQSKPESAQIEQLLAIAATGRGDEKSADKHQQQYSRTRKELDLREIHYPGIKLSKPQYSNTNISGNKSSYKDSDLNQQMKPISLKREGELWRVEFAGEQVLLKHNKGLELLDLLLSKPDKQIHVLDLITPTGRSQQSDSSDSGPMLDDQSRAEYKKRIRVLQEELEESEELLDLGRTELLHEEMDFITRELSRAYGLGGRRRTSGSNAERARVNVQRRLRDAIKRIENQLPKAGRYLKNTIKTGSYCQYTPL